MKPSIRTPVFLCVLVVGGCAGIPPSKPVQVPLPPLPATIPELLERLSDPNSSVRRQAAWSLASASARETGVDEGLRRAIEDDVRDVRYAAAWALGHLQDRDSQAENGTFFEKAPKLVRKTRPQYPRKAFDARIEGTVLLEILIGEEGEVVYAEVRRSLPELDSAALACVKQWQFEPAERGGKPIATVANAPVAFRLY